jgi:hypothetical protein
MSNNELQNRDMFGNKLLPEEPVLNNVRFLYKYINEYLEIRPEVYTQITNNDICWKGASFFMIDF